MITNLRVLDMQARVHTFEKQQHTVHDGRAPVQSNFPREGSEDIWVRIKLPRFWKKTVSFQRALGEAKRAFLPTSVFRITQSLHTGDARFRANPTTLHFLDTWISTARRPRVFNRLRVNFTVRGPHICTSVRALFSCINRSRLTERRADPNVHSFLSG